jgi:hypothetical protein
MHGYTGGIMNVGNGGEFLSGFASGAASSLVSSGMQGLGTLYAGDVLFGSTTLFKAVSIAAGGLSGGISSTIAGGNFWTGASKEL